jgi:hypothetical protein
MLRNTLIALSAVAALGVTALAPTSASAGAFGFKHHHHHPHFGWGWGVGYPAYVGGPDCFFKKKFTPFGWKLVKVCVY